MSDEREIIAKGKTLLIRPWTEDEDARLLQMVAQKRHRSIIAARLRRTKGGIVARLRVLRRSAKINPVKETIGEGDH